MNFVTLQGLCRQKLQEGAGREARGESVHPRSWRAGNGLQGREWCVGNQSVKRKLGERLLFLVGTLLLTGLPFQILIGLATT